VLRHIAHAVIPAPVAGIQRSAISETRRQSADFGSRAQGAQGPG